MSDRRFAVSRILGTSVFDKEPAWLTVYEGNGEPSPQPFRDFTGIENQWLFWDCVSKKEEEIKTLREEVHGLKQRLTETDQRLRRQVDFALDQLRKSQDALREKAAETKATKKLLAQGVRLNEALEWELNKKSSKMEAVMERNTFLLGATFKYKHIVAQNRCLAADLKKITEDFSKNSKEKDEIITMLMNKLEKSTTHERNPCLCDSIVRNVLGNHNT